MNTSGGRQDPVENAAQWPRAIKVLSRNTFVPEENTQNTDEGSRKGWVMNRLSNNLFYYLFMSSNKLYDIRTPRVKSGKI